MIPKMMRWFLAIAIFAAVGACRDKDTEKRIAELEAQVKELQGQKTAAPANVVPGLTAANTPAKAATPDVKPEGPLPAAQFSEIEHDFGTITEGQVVEHTYTIKNTGEAPLIISEAKPSCGCTAPDWTKTAIPPRGSGFVKAKFDSSGKPGIQNKTITVVANTYPKQTVLRFKAMVAAKPTGENGPVK